MARRLNIRQLEAFRAVMVSGTTTRAAAALGVSQSSVSRLITELEGQLGSPLFARGHGRLNPTEQAEWLFEEAEDVLSRLDRLDTAARDIRHLSIGELKIVASPPLASALVPESVRRLRAQYPNLRVTMQVTFRREVRAWTDAQLFDIALTTLPIDYSKAHIEPLASTSGVCILPPGHRLAEKPIIDAADLADEPFIAPLPEAFSRFRLDRLFEELGIRRNKPMMESHTAFTICQMVAAGLGVAVIDPFTAHTFAPFGITIRPFTPTLDYDYGIAYPLRRPRSRLADALAATVRQVVSENPLYAPRAPASPSASAQARVGSA